MKISKPTEWSIYVQKWNYCLPQFVDVGLNPLSYNKNPKHHTQDRIPTKKGKIMQTNYYQFFVKLSAIHKQNRPIFYFANSPIDQIGQQNIIHLEYDYILG